MIWLGCSRIMLAYFVMLTWCNICPYGSHCLIFAPIVCHFVGGCCGRVPPPPSGLHGFLFLPSYDLWPMFENSISFCQPQCMPQHIQFVLSYLCEGGWFLVNKQLLGHSQYPRKVLNGRTCWQLDCLCIYVTFSFIIGC